MNFLNKHESFISFFTSAELGNSKNVHKVFTERVRATEKRGREGGRERLAMTYLHLHIKVDTGPSSQALSQCNGSCGGEAEPKQDMILDCVVFSGLRLHVGSNL